MSDDLEHEVHAALHQGLLEVGWCDAEETYRQAEALAPVVVRLIEAHRAPLVEDRITGYPDHYVLNGNVERCFRGETAEAEAKELGELIGTYDEIANEDRAAVAEARKAALLEAADELLALWHDGTPGVAGVEGSVRWLRARADAHGSTP